MSNPNVMAYIDVPGVPIADMEKILNKIESSKNVEPDAEALDKLLDQYVEGMQKAYLSAKADKTKLKEFQTAAKGFETRLKNIESKVKLIEGKIKTGEIKLSKAVLQKLTSAEKKEFKNFLNPDALKAYERLHPDLFKPTTTPHRTAPRSSVESYTVCAQSSISFLEGLFVTPAYAGVICDTCRGAYNACKKACCRCKWYKPWCCACKVGCAIAFSGCLAVCTIV